MYQCRQLCIPFTKQEGSSATNTTITSDLTSPNLVHTIIFIEMLSDTLILLTCLFSEPRFHLYVTVKCQHITKFLCLFHVRALMTLFYVKI